MLDNPALKPEVKVEGFPKYTTEEQDYYRYMTQRLTVARDMREQNHDEFDGMTYTEYYESNEKLANSYITPKKNKQDTHFVTGTTRQALLALTAKQLNLNIEAQVKAYDSNEFEIVEMGKGMEITLAKANELDHDEEKKLMRQYELYKQGTVFVQDCWEQEFKVNKKLKTMDWKGEVGGVDWSEKMEKCFEGPRRTVIRGTQVFLGSLSNFEMDSQPFSATVEYLPYDVAKAVFGSWERWKYVPKNMQPMMPGTTDADTNLYSTWRMTRNFQNNMCEVVRYQDVPNNEYMIIINGIMMNPVGFPLPWGYGGSNLVKQVYELIRADFPYGGSLPKRLRSSQMLEDEFWRLALLKTQKSFFPPYANMTGKILSSKVFMPGVITQGIDASAIKPIGESVGVTSPELAVMKMLRDNLNDNSMNPVSQGQSTGGGQTATEILQVQREAKLVLGLANFAATMLEKKLAQLRLCILLNKWFEPDGTVLDEVRQQIVPKYRNASMGATIEGEGKGRKMVQAMEGPLPTSDDVYMEEEILKKKLGYPVRKIYLDAKAAKEFQMTWHVEAFPKEKESSEMQKVLFGQMMQNMQMFGPDINLAFLEEKFSQVWDIPYDKAFKQQAQAATNGQAMPETTFGVGQGQPNAAAMMPDMEKMSSAEMPV